MFNLANIVLFDFIDANLMNNSLYNTNYLHCPSRKNIAALRRLRKFIQSRKKRYGQYFAYRHTQKT
jgi:hypothetical protein